MAGKPGRSGRPKGSGSPEAAERQRLILYYYRQGHTVRETAGAFGVHPSWVHKITQGEPRRERERRFPGAPKGKKWLYGLRGGDGIIRYIGCGIVLAGRFAAHRNVTSRKNSPLGEWLRKEVAAGTLEMVPLRLVGVSSAFQLETQEICRRLAKGEPLLNVLQITRRERSPESYAIKRELICRLHKEGRSFKTIAEWVQLSPQRVSQIVHAAHIN